MARITRTLATTIAVTALASTLACGSRRVESGGAVTNSSVNAMLSGWPAKSREAATATIQRYGQPDESTASMLIWHNNGSWKRTIVYREEVPHSFPKQHTDMLEQFIDYRVASEWFDDLAAYDGSVIVERTKGEISARCDKEAMNFLALNLANEIVNSRLTVQQARQTYAQQAMAFMNGQTSDWTTGLRFTPARGGTMDPDSPAMP